MPLSLSRIIRYRGHGAVMPYGWEGTQSWTPSAVNNRPTTVTCLSHSVAVYDVPWPDFQNPEIGESGQSSRVNAALIPDRQLPAVERRCGDSEAIQYVKV